ncbi:MAG: S1 RNA-binding domain-containing protein, partial [Lachnospiraceae bacterium]|nr:S1 RNA-binding domain-containing protein [Lachnospiraceae bacterium]
EGTVKSVTDFGAFIDLGGADGLLHITEMGWNRIGNPKKHFKPGDSVRAFVKSINGKKIGLSKKFPDENPWLNAEERFAVGTVITGKVARLTDFGAFVNLAEGIDGLIHVSQITRDRVEKPSDVLELGQEVTAKIIALNTDEKKISLSMKALLPKQERPERKPRGNRAPREESFENEDGTVNIAKYIAKLDREEALKAEKEKAEAEAAKAAEAVQEKAAEAVAEAVEEAKPEA